MKMKLVAIIIASFVLSGLILAGVYFYLDKQLTELSTIPEAPAKQEIIEPEETSPPIKEELPEDEEIIPEEITPPEEKPTEEVEPIITCQDECLQTGLKRCSNNGYQICGDYDADGYLEWNSITNCPAGTICQNGICKNIETPCQDKFKMAFILVAKDGSELTSERIDKVNQIKDYFSDDFHTATQNLGYMDTSYEIVTMIDDGSLMSENYITKMAVTKKFYESNPDEFDFVTIYTTFETPSQMSHRIVKNNIEGIGQNIFDNSESYGSGGKLMGINFMKNINMHLESDPDTNISSGLLHETGHQWCCYVGDKYGSENSNLPILGDLGIHWHCVSQLDDFNTKQSDPMGGCSWIDNGDGTFTRKDVKAKVPIYHKLTLYLMGLLPKKQVPDIKLILPEQDPPYWQWYEPLNASVRYITINDISSRYGEIKCEK